MELSVRFPMRAAVVNHPRHRSLGRVPDTVLVPLSKARVVSYPPWETCLLACSSRQAPT